MKPDYTNLRAQTKFRWDMGATYAALLEVTGIPIKEYFLNPSAGIELYRRGEPVLRDMFGPDVKPAGLATPPVSYGHVNGLGADLIFPDGGEVSHTKIADTLEKGIALARQKVDFEKAGMAPFYLEYRRKLMEAFPGRPCAFGYKSEGPLTTAYLLRGEGVFADPYDQPELFKEFLRLLTDSAIEFSRFECRVAGAPEVDPDAGGLADDIAAMFGPDMWPEFVLPYWDQHFRGVTTGRRNAHVEDLRPEHLPYLEAASLSKYDPSVSPKISPRIISRMCRVPFGWRLVNFHYPAMSLQDIRDFVFQATADGASLVFSHVADGMCNEATAKKVKAFVEAGKEAEQMLGKGASRESVGGQVSAEGRRKFWDRWPQ